MAVFRRSSAGATDGTAQDSVGAKNPGAADKREVRGGGQEGPPHAQAQRGRARPLPVHPGRHAPAAAGPHGGHQDPGAASREKAGTRTTAPAAWMPSGGARSGPSVHGTGDRHEARPRLRRRPPSAQRVLHVCADPAFVLLVTHALKQLARDLHSLLVALLVVILVDGFLIRRALTRLVTERLPGESTRGLTVYAVMRAMQIRRLRVPTPRLKPGDKF